MNIQPGGFPEHVTGLVTSDFGNGGKAVLDPPEAKAAEVTATEAPAPQVAPAEGA